MRDDLGDDLRALLRRDVAYWRGMAEERAQDLEAYDDLLKLLDDSGSSDVLSAILATLGFALAKDRVRETWRAGARRLAAWDATDAAKLHQQYDRARKASAAANQSALDDETLLEIAARIEKQWPSEPRMDQYKRMWSAVAARGISLSIDTIRKRLSKIRGATGETETLHDERSSMI